MEVGLKMDADTQDLSYELLKYVNRWVASLESEQRVVGSGSDACEIQRRKGWPKR
jgi:hypothetical protein